MDVNGTRFQLLLGRGDWETCTDQSGHRLEDLWSAPATSATAPVVWDAKRCELTLQPRPYLFSAKVASPPAPSSPPGGVLSAPAGLRPLTFEDRRGADRDRYGNWYWIDLSRTRVRVMSSGTGLSSHFWARGDQTSCERPASPSAGFGRFEAAEPWSPPPPLWLGGLAVTDDHYLVVGVTEPSGLLIFDLQAGGPPSQVLWPDGVPFSPFDMARRPGGGVFVLDRENSRYWQLDRHFLVVSVRSPSASGPPAAVEAFEPVEGEHPSGTAPGGPAPVTLEDSAEVLCQPTAADAAGPVAIEVVSDGSVLILEQVGYEAPSVLHRYRSGAEIGAGIDTADPAISLFVTGHDIALVPPEQVESAQRSLLGMLYVADRIGNQSFAFTLETKGGQEQLSLTLIEEYFPMRRFAGKALVAAGGRAHYDLEERWIPLVRQDIRRYVAEGTITTDLWDGREPGCAWHRLMLDACLPSETTVMVWSAASDDADTLRTTPEWLREPDLYRRANGSEMAFTPQGPHDPTDPFGTWETLFQRAHGRYLRLRLKLTGNERATPHVRALRAYFPRFSYLSQYLPAVYREDSESASFLDRYLANVEGFNTAIEDKVASVQVLFDVRSVPVDALEWLGGWFGLAMDPAWDEKKRRFLIGHAMEFFKYRGTMRGLEAALGLALEDRPDPSLFSLEPSPCARRTRIVEAYQTKRTPGVALGDPTSPGGSGLVPPGGRWRPSDGPDALHQRYRDYLAQAGLDPSADTVFPLSAPSDPEDPEIPTKAAAWRKFSEQVLGFVPAATPADTPRWQDFLARRYVQPAVLNTTYQLIGTAQITGFVDAVLPEALPSREPALMDWYQFEYVVLASWRTAHRFTVLLPAPGNGGGKDTRLWSDAAGGQIDLARRIVDLEKPAHTVFDVKFYWLAFRVGEARLGKDTSLSLGSRSPYMRPDAVLGRAYLGESFLQSPTALSAATRPSLISTGRPR